MSETRDETGGLPLFDRHPYAGRTPRVRGSDTSEAAGDSALPNAGTVRRRVYDAILGRPRTDEEIERLLGLRHQTASARRRELVLLGLVEDSLRRRQTSSGRFATVWKAVGA